MLEDETRVRQLEDEVAELRNLIDTLRGGDSGGGSSGGGGAVIVRVTGHTSPSALGGGKYWGKVQRRTATAFAANTTNLNLVTFYEDNPTIATVLLINLADHNFVVNPLSVTANYVAAFATSETDSVSGAPVYFTRAFGWTACA